MITALKLPSLVTPAKAGVSGHTLGLSKRPWIPASAGMTWLGEQLKQLAHDFMKED